MDFYSIQDVFPEKVVFTYDVDSRAWIGLAAGATTQFIAEGPCQLPGHAGNVDAPRNQGLSTFYFI